MLDILATLFIVVVSTTIASYIVARLVREPLHAASAGDEDFVIDHEFKYLDELETLDRLPLAEAALRDLRGRVATDDTPCGRVAVTYDPDEGRFDYWSERSQVPYKTLDAVARKFCVENDCRAIYLDVYEELYLEAVRTNRAALDAAAAAVAVAEMASGTTSPASDDDRTNLYGDSAGDSAGGAGSAGSAGSYLDLDGDLDDDDDETKPLLERSAGTELDVAPPSEKAQVQAQAQQAQAQQAQAQQAQAQQAQAQQTEKAEKAENKAQAQQAKKPSPFAAFKSYNAPAKRVHAAAAAADGGGPERPTKNTFKRRGTYREWEAGIAAATLVAQHAAATGLAKTLPMAEEAEARRGARRRRHFNISYDDFKRQTRSASALGGGAPQ